MRTHKEPNGKIINKGTPQSYKLEYRVNHNRHIASQLKGLVEYAYNLYLCFIFFKDGHIYGFTRKALLNVRAVYDVLYPADKLNRNFYASFVRFKLYVLFLDPFNSFF